MEVRQDDVKRENATRENKKKKKNTLRESEAIKTLLLSGHRYKVEYM